MENNCVFCKLKEAIDKDRIIYEDSDWLAVLDNYPVSEGHTLLIPKRHCETFFDLSDVENQYFIAILNVVKGILDGRYKPDGYNIGMNCGEAAGQTVMHCHIHIIPRYKGDCENPRGGVRGCIPSRMNY